MTSHAITLLIQVSAKQYTDAARQLRDGNADTNPLAQALIEKGDFALIRDFTTEIGLRDIRTGRCYTGALPVVLAEYLAGFRRGVRVFEDHIFELALVSDD